MNELDGTETIARPRPWMAAVLTACAVAGLLGVLGTILIHPDVTQWDFRIYYYSALAFRQGENPYDLEVISRLSGHSFQLGYLYPPASLYFFRPFTSLPYDVAARVWLFLKAGCLAGLVLLWHREFLRKAVPLSVLALTTLLAFDGAAVWDLRSGNISILEQLLLWTAFAVLVRRRWFLFSILLCLAAFFKISLLAFSAVYLFLEGRPRTVRAAYMTGTVLLGGALSLGPLAGSHLGLFRDALSRDPYLFGDVNPSFSGLFLSLTGGTAFPWGAWAVFAGAVLAVSAWRFRSAGSARMPVKLGVLATVYMLIVPRGMVYSYLLLVPSLFLAWLPAARRAGLGPWAIVALVCLVGLRDLRPQELGGALLANQSFLIALGFWLLLCVTGVPGGVRNDLPPGSRLS